MRPLHTLTIAEAGDLIASRTITAEALTAACLEQIKAHTALNAFVTVFADEARAAAREADRETREGRRRGPLHGIPISIKDLIDMRGTPTSAGSRVRAGHVADRDAPIISRLRAAGVIFIGKCNLHEFAFGTTSDESAYGPVGNPADPSRSAGGSSGGSAAAVAAGMSLASIGTDTGGSIRIPAAACGVVGLKPTFGELPLDGIVPLGRSLDHVGPIARSVTDAWLLFAVMKNGVGPNARPRGSGQAISTVRLGWPARYVGDLIDPEVRQRFEEAIERLRKAGARVDEVQIPHADDIGPIYLHLVLAEAAAYHAATLEARAADYSPGVRLRLEMGRFVLAEDYLRAMRGREVITAEVDAALHDRHGLVLPSLAIPAPTIGETTVTFGKRTESIRNVMLRLTQPFNLTGHPAISMSCGRTAAGLPCGLQLVGQHGYTERLLLTALACEPFLT